jgi:LmbE family N-acetylglucosaminyl deacetylase
MAPHPDDETLGAGGLIAALTDAGAAVNVAILTDGSGSHAGAPGWSARRIADLRATEANAALRALGHRHRPLFLGWRDAEPFAPGSPSFDATVRRLVMHCRRQGIRNLVASWAADPHCDHEAAAAIATAVGRRLGIKPRFYGVWGWARVDLDRRLGPMLAVAVPTGASRGRQRRALNCHRSQLGCRITGAPNPFVLPRAMRRLVDVNHALLLEYRRAP